MADVARGSSLRYTLAPFCLILAFGFVFLLGLVWNKRWTIQDDGSISAVGSGFLS